MFLSCFACLHSAWRVPGWRIGESSLDLEGTVLGYNTEMLPVDHSGIRVLSVPRSLHDKDLFYRFRKTVGAL